MWRSIGKGVLFKTSDVKVQVPELWRQYALKSTLFYGTSQICYLKHVEFFEANVLTEHIPPLQNPTLESKTNFPTTQKNITPFL